MNEQVARFAAQVKASRWLTRDQYRPLDRPATFVGPITRGLRRRTVLIHIIICLVGALPFIASHFGLTEVSPKLELLGWTLWAPGGSFLAMGGWGIAGFIFTILLFRFTVFVWLMTGALILPLTIWIGSAAVASLIGESNSTEYGRLAVALCVPVFWCYQLLVTKSDQRKVEKSRLARNEWLEYELSQLDQSSSPLALEKDRELSPESIRAARYLFDLALQPVGKFDGFVRIDNIQGAALRYQLNWLSYGLAQMQCNITPNFHGYLNQAQRFAIESLALPEVCGYWKYESLVGNFTWTLDPIGTKDNVMLTGWSLIPLTTYAANTGDTRYQQQGSLKFQPSKNNERRFSHSAHTFVESIVNNWNRNSLFLYPCEPHWTFGICNIYAMCGLFPYDRTNNTDVAGKHYDEFMNKFDNEFVAANGEMIPIVSAMTGLNRFSRPMPAIQLLSQFAVAFHGSAVSPAYARQTYAIAKRELLEVAGGRIKLKTPWSKEMDIGNYKKNPSYTLANIAQAAAEQGDEVVLKAALATAEDLLPRGKDEQKFYYEEISTSSNIKLATATWSKRGDWQRLINEGPRRGAFTGPILSDCSYPQVLVARAVSDGNDLDLVLYNGSEPDEQTLTIERLQPNSSYSVEGASIDTCVSDENGRLKIAVYLSGRTPVRFVLSGS